MFEELDTVELTHDIKEYGLKEEDLGAVVNVYNDGKAYEVEFVAPNGRTIALLTLMPSDIRSALSKREHFSYGLNPSIYAHNASARIFTLGDPISGVDLVVKTRDEKNTKEFHYSFV